VIVVSNASPIISLGAVNRLGLLRELFGEILIPQAVLAEVKSLDLSAEPWIIPRPLGNDFVSRALEGELDRGESEAIALAVELQAGLLLMDEHRGRRIASRFSLKVLGTLGVLVEAKSRQLVAEVRPILSDLRTKVGFRTEEALLQRILEAAGEA